MDEITIKLYAQPSGSEPYTEWEKNLNRETKAIISSRLARVRGGNFGDSTSVGEGVYELRIHCGPGYRIYYGKRGKTVVVLLCAGDKGSQKRDIRQAKVFWTECLKREKTRGKS